MERIYTDTSALHDISKPVTSKQNSTALFAKKLNIKAKAFWLFFIFIGLLDMKVSSAALEWDGSKSTDWNDSRNWSGSSPRRVPLATDDVTIPSVTNKPAITTAAVCLSLTINASSSLTINSGGNITVYGNWTNNGTFTPNSSTVDFAGTGAGNIGTSNFNNITFSGAGTKTATGALTIAGNVNITNNFTAGSFTHTIVGNWANNGTFTASTSSVSMKGSNGQKIEGPTSFNNLEINNSSGSAIMGSDQTVNGELKLTNGALNIDKFTLNLNGTVSGNGTLTGGTGSTLAIGGSSGGNLGTINFTGGTGTLYALSINRDLGSATIGSNLTVGAGGLTITKGVIEVSAGKSLRVNGTTS